MNIVDINKYKKKKESVKMFEEIIADLKQHGQTGNEYSFEEIIQIARNILSQTPYYYHKSSTPIMRIAEEFGIITYKTDTLSEDLSGVIYSGGTTKDIYGSDKVILVDENEHIKHQRFVVAHEVAHYLLDCLTNPKYDDGKLLFSEGYPKTNHDSPKEFRADMFAAELLMPSKLFITQYNLAMEEKNNRVFTVMYLSEFFQTKVSSIEKRIVEVL